MCVFNQVCVFIVLVLILPSNIFLCFYALFTIFFKFDASAEKEIRQEEEKYNKSIF